MKILAVLFALADLAAPRVNLGRMQAIAFQLQYRLATNRGLAIGTTPHARAVALQLRDDELVDPWGTPYRIEIEGNVFRVIGAGSDRKFNPDEWAVRGQTYTLEADNVFGPDLPLRSNASYVNRGKHEWPYRLYEVPAFVPLDKRAPGPLMTDEAAALRYQSMWEQASIVLRYGEVDALRATRTLTSMQLLASRLDDYGAKHGAMTNDLLALQRDPWPYNDWIESVDAWGTPLRIDLVDGGRSYRIVSAGSDRQFDAAPKPAGDTAADQIIAAGVPVRTFDRAAWTERETARRDAGDREAMQQRQGAAVALPDGSTAYRIGGDVQAPAKLSGPEPVYPESLLAQKIGGLIIVEVVIDEGGRVAAANVLHSPNPQLSDAVVAALRQWTFRPAMLHGKAVRSILNYTVVMRPRS
ncbi:MAG TPA: energy transducer TonB [Thermoanaerobaculia bacterium]|nr:energy transducer TonB [Thermoanaerobaculia bacterium]